MTERPGDDQQSGEPRDCGDPPAGARYYVQPAPRDDAVYVVDRARRRAAADEGHPAPVDAATTVVGVDVHRAVVVARQVPPVPAERVAARHLGFDVVPHPGAARAPAEAGERDAPATAPTGRCGGGGGGGGRA